MSETSNAVLPSVVLNGDQVYLDELVRENARLAVKLQVEKIRYKELEDKFISVKKDYESENFIINEKIQSDYEKATVQVTALRSKLQKAQCDIAYLMKGGDPCKICSKSCKMGEECVPIWKEGSPE